MGNGRKILYWFIIGVSLSVVVSSMVFTRHGRLLQFYDDGYVKELKDTWLNTVSILNQYDEKQKIMHLDVGEGNPAISWVRETEDVHYLWIDTEYWNGTKAEWKISYQDGDGNFFYEKIYDFQQGKMMIPILNMECSNIYITLYSSGNLQYKLNSLKLSEYEELMDKRKWIFGMAVCFCVYFMISVVGIYLFRNGDKREGGKRRTSAKKRETYFLEEQADLILEYLNRPSCKEVYASKIRIILFILLIVNGRVMHFSHRPESVAITLILLLTLAAWVPIEEVGEKQRHTVMKVWLTLCIFQFLSNLLLKKEFGYAEFIEVWMILGFGIFYRAWGRMKEPQKLLDELFRACEILLALVSIYCLIGQSRVAYIGRMTGTWKNPNPFALGISMYFVIMLFRLYQVIVKRKIWYYYLEPLIGIGFGIWMIHSAESRNALAIVAIVTFVFICFTVNYLCRNVSKGKKYFIFVLISGIFVIGSLIALKSGVIFSTRTFRVTSLNAFLSERPDIWKAYLEKVNLIGCKDNLIPGEGNSYVHNGVIMVMYRYGIIAGIVEIVFLIEVVCAIFRVWKRSPRSEYAFWSVGVFISYFVSSMLDTCDEGIISWIGWITFYIMVGYIIQENRVGLLEYDER